MVEGLWHASGSPVPPAEFATGILALRSLRAAIAFALRASLTGEAGSRSTGDPSLTASSVALIASFKRTGEAGIGERLRSDEAP